MAARRRICALPAFWVGLLYDDAALDAAEDLTRDWTFEEVTALREAVPVHRASTPKSAAAACMGCAAICWPLRARA
jgi:gamma-glutamylcysteine synthetase